MELFKPYVNLTKSQSTGVYTLNSVVSVPKGYALSSLQQGVVEKNGKQLWGVTATIVANGSSETEIAEFSVPLDQGPTEEIKTTSMIMVESGAIAKSEASHSTDVDYDDAEGTV